MWSKGAKGFGLALFLQGVAFAGETTSTSQHSQFDVTDVLGVHIALAGEFSQRQVIPGVDGVLESSGEFYYLRGEALVWRTENPVPTEMVLSDSKTDEDAPRAVRRIQRLILDLMSANVLEDKRFHSVVKGDAEQWRLELQPAQRRMRRFVESVFLSGDQYLRRIVLNLVQGRRSDIRFTNVEPVPNAVVCEQAGLERELCAG